MIQNHKRSLVEESLEKLGVRSLCYVMAHGGKLDDQTVPISMVLDHHLGASKDVIAYDFNVNAGYYENHEGKIYVFSSA